MRSAPSQEEPALKMMNGTCLNMQDLQFTPELGSSACRFVQAAGGAKVYLEGCKVSALQSQNARLPNNKIFRTRILL
ncbi:hypothetical protein Y1Q_0021454 [Alligator mississippiensis]|uniref:Uncharacterized protein n=1 Tax=Alligator mississippiensis TaxID=8496 RepID=A0A151P9W1_ALLMI|nr:hypothetical protein Y1Q_0021454 [Alligator mississippiensis]